MYDIVDVEISRKYLDKVNEILDEPIVMLGGWVKTSVSKLVGEDVFGKFKDTINEEDLIESSRILDLDIDLVKNAINRLVE